MPIFERSSSVSVRRRSKSANSALDTNYSEMNDTPDVNLKPSTKRKKSTRKGEKIVTGNTVPQRVTILTEQDEGESNNDNVNLVSEYSEEINSINTNNDEYFFNLSEHTIDRLYKCMQTDEEVGKASLAFRPTMILCTRHPQAGSTAQVNASLGEWSILPFPNPRQ